MALDRRSRTATVAGRVVELTSRGSTSSGLAERPGSWSGAIASSGRSGARVPRRRARSTSTSASFARARPSRPDPHGAPRYNSRRMSSLASVPRHRGDGARVAGRHRRRQRVAHAALAGARGDQGARAPGGAIMAQRRENPATSTQAHRAVPGDGRAAARDPHSAQAGSCRDPGAARLRSDALASGHRAGTASSTPRANGTRRSSPPGVRQAADWTPFALGLGLAGLVGAALAAVVAAPPRAVATSHAGVRREPGTRRRCASGALRASGPRKVAALATSFNDLAAEHGRTQEVSGRSPLRQPRAERPSPRSCSTPSAPGRHRAARGGQ